MFKTDSSRGSDVLLKMLGEEFDGVLGCAYFSAYRKYMKDSDIAVQFCLTHMIREVKFLLTLPDRATRTTPSGCSTPCANCFASSTAERKWLQSDSNERRSGPAKIC